jgi:hypothetical protein
MDAVDLAAAARACRFRIKEMSPGYARLYCGFSWWSYGENIKVQMAEIDGAVMVDVVSSCVIPVQIEDWGKNAKNVHRFFAAINRQMGATESQAVACCHECGYLLAGIAVQKCPECGAGLAMPPPVSRSFRHKLRSMMIGLASLTFAEVGLVGLLQHFGKLPDLLATFTGVRGVLRLIVVNLASSVGVLVLARSWRPNR